MSELTPEERFVTDLVAAAGRPIELFSLHNPATVNRHFRWIHDYGIDGVFVQRFGCNLRRPEILAHTTKMLGSCRAAAWSGLRGHARLERHAGGHAHRGYRGLAPPARPDAGRQRRGLAAERGLRYLPVAFPGFRWHNLKGGKLDQIPRRGGRFFRSQAVGARRVGADSLYVAMFDEVDEATAIFKCIDPPTPELGRRFIGMEGLPSDHYLPLTGEIGRLLRGERPPSDKLP